MEANRVYLKLHHFKKVLELLGHLRDKIMTGGIEIIDTLSEIDTIYDLLDNTKVEEE